MTKKEEAIKLYGTRAFATHEAMIKMMDLFVEFVPMYLHDVFPKASASDKALKLLGNTLEEKIEKIHKQTDDKELFTVAMLLSLAREAHSIKEALKKNTARVCNNPNCTNPTCPNRDKSSLIDHLKKKDV